MNIEQLAHPHVLEYVGDWKLEYWTALRPGLYTMTGGDAGGHGGTFVPLENPIYNRHWRGRENPFTSVAYDVAARRVAMEVNQLSTDYTNHGWFVLTAEQFAVFLEQVEQDQAARDAHLAQCLSHEFVRSGNLICAACGGHKDFHTKVIRKGCE